jgi:hypothetical protein
MIPLAFDLPKAFAATAWLFGFFIDSLMQVILATLANKKASPLCGKAL